jgi:hypothetical protein
LSRGNVDVLVLQAEVTRAWVAAVAVEDALVMAILATETSAHGATVVWDSVALRIKDAEDWATLAEREARERVSRVEVENAVALAYAHEDA